MRLRVRVGRQTHTLLLEEERPSLGGLRRKLSASLLPSLGYSPDTTFSITLNGRDALTEDEASLESLSVIPGDLIVLLIDSTASSMPESAPTHGQNAFTRSSEASVHPVDRGKEEAAEESDPGTSHGAQVEQEAAQQSVALSITQEPMLCAESADGKIPHTLESLYVSADCASANDALTVAIHLLMLETGYVEQDSRSKVASMPEGWRRGDGVYNLRYSHPLCPGSFAGLLCVPMGTLLIINATLSINNEIKFTKRLQLRITSYISFPVQENHVASGYRDLQKLSRLFKDQLVYPLLAATRQALELPDVFGLVVLPLELKLRILRLLDVRSILSLAATCKDLHSGTEDPALWRFLYMRDFRDKNPRNLRTDWKQLYKEKTKQTSALRRRHNPYPPDIYLPSRPSPFTPDVFPPNFPYPPGIIGGEYDQRPILPLGRDPMSFLVPGRDPATGLFQPLRPRFDPLLPGRIRRPPRSEFGPFSPGGFF